MSPKTISAIICVSAISLLAAPAIAASNVQFSYDSRELQSTTGVKGLHARLTAAANKLCTTPGRRPLSEKKLETLCADQLADEFVTKIDHPQLDRVHAAAAGSVRLAKTR